MFEALAATLARSLGGVFGRSRRGRIIRWIRDYHVLAKEIEANDPGAAEVLRSVAGAWVLRLAELEKASLARRFEPTMFLAYLIFIAPAAIGAYFAYTERGWWTWPAIIVCGFWAAVVILAAWNQVEEAARLKESEGQDELLGAEQT